MNYENKTLNVSVTCTQGLRPYMEDTYAVNKTKHADVLAVFDGHGGDRVATMCAQSFIPLFLNTLQRYPEPSTVFHQVFHELDDQAKNLPMQQGCTALASCLHNNRFWFANCGDSMAMTGLLNDTVLMVSRDHKVENEAERIRQRGGLITYDDCPRIHHMLNIGRSIGDHHLKDYVIATPYVTSVPSQLVDYILLGTDGLWDVYNAEQIAKEIKQIRQLCKVNGLDKKQTTDEISRSLVEQALERGSTDNITVIFAEIENS